VQEGVASGSMVSNICSSGGGVQVNGVNLYALSGRKLGYGANCGRL